VTEIVVTAPARLHFGMLDPAGRGARRFGGFGVGVESPRVVVGVRLRSAGGVVSPAEGVVVSPAEGVVVSGPQAERAATFAQRARAAFGIGEGVEVNVREAIPPHGGLGSGTKLGLAIARGVGELAGVSAGPEQLARASGRGARSSVGSWTFAAPGLVVEAGVPHDGWISPVVARHPMPERWRCVLALPRGVEGLSGNAEERFFSLLHEERTAIEPRVSRLLLTALLPGLLTGNIDEFGTALTQIQRDIGSMFAAEQGGVFHPRAAPLVDALLALGVGAVGQSSWGPAVYGIVDGPELAAETADRLRVAAGADTDVVVVDFDRRGARVARDGSGQAAA
jgi:beta-ribofuranosylaminobenzene 5'-phosphate synthase